MDGIDLSGLFFKGKEPEQRPIIFHFPIYLQGKTNEEGINQDVLFRTRPGSSVRLGDYKLIHYYEKGEYELYNLKNDPGEKVNLSQHEPEKVNELKAVLDKWIQETDAPLPTELNPEYDAEYEQQQINKLLN